MINRPNNNIITLSIKDFAGDNVGNLPHYCLYLSMEGISTDEIETNNKNDTTKLVLR
jgi:hypothetical protein